MSLDTRRRVRTSYAPELDLPPPFRPVALREAGDAFAHAVRIAADAGAGTPAHVGRFDLIEFALVLEPDEPLRQARRADFVDGAHAGGGRLAWPDGAAEDARPDWLVFGAMVRAAAMETIERQKAGKP